MLMLPIQMGIQLQQVLMKETHGSILLVVEVIFIIQILIQVSGQKQVQLMILQQHLQYIILMLLFQVMIMMLYGISQIMHLNLKIMLKLNSVLDLTYLYTTMEAIVILQKIVQDLVIYIYNQMLILYFKIMMLQVEVVQMYLLNLLLEVHVNSIIIL